MKKFGRGGKRVVLAALSLTAAIAAFAACGETEEVVITPVSAPVTAVGAAPDYLSLFTVTVGGKPYAVTADMIDSSAVDLATAGEYTVTIRFTVNGREYTSSVTLKVETATENTVVVTPADQTTTVGVAPDYTALFTVTVNGQPYAVTQDMLDISAVNLNETGSYLVKFSAVIAGKNYSSQAYVFVNDAVKPDLAAALAHGYGNYTLTTTVSETEDGKEYSYTETRKVTDGKFSYDFAAEWKTEAYRYVTDGDGVPTECFVFMDSTQSWKRSESGADEYVYFVDFSDFTEENFQYLGGTFYANVDDGTAALIGAYLFNAMPANAGEFTEFTLKVNGGVVTEFAGKTAEDIYFKAVLTALGSTEIEIPYVEPIVEITALPGEVQKGAANFDYKTLFTVTVDKKTVAVTDAMIDASAVNLNEEGTYDVVLTFTAENGREEHTKTAHLTVTAPRDNTFAEALRAAAANCTVVKVTFSGSGEEKRDSQYNIDGNSTYKTDLVSGTNMLFVRNNTELLEYAISNGEAVTPGKTSKIYIPRMDLFAEIANDFVQSGNTYTYAGGRLSEIFIATTGFSNATMYSPINFEVLFEDGAIKSIKINYLGFKKNCYHLYTVSNVGTTVLPAEVPEA